MYDYAGQPWKTQEKVREVLRRLYLGSEIGQGYAGDEDNGETSAWYLFSALGFYPLQVGSPYYAIGSPLFTKATVHLENGKDIVVNAPENSARNVYVQGLKVDGASLRQGLPAARRSSRTARRWTSTWARRRRAGRPARTPRRRRSREDDDVPRPLRDATGAAATRATGTRGR